MALSCGPHTKLFLGYYKAIQEAPITHLLEKAIDQSNCPNGVMQVVSDSTSQKFIPDKHGFIEDMTCLIITYIFLKTTHNLVWVAEKEVFCEIHRA